MRFPLNIILKSLILMSVFFSSCKTKDPFVREAAKSSLQAAEQFITVFLNPRKSSRILDGWEKFSAASRDYISTVDYETIVREQFFQQRIVGKEIDVSPWEKFSLKDGRVLVYMLVKENFHELRRVWKNYYIYRLCLGKEGEDWRVYADLTKPFKGPFIVEKGIIENLDDDKIIELKQLVKLDYEKFQFKLDMESLESPEISLANKCVAEGEKFYDQEEYRKALMQFQKALSIDPDNEKSKTYIARCKKAINYNMGK